MTFSDFKEICSKYEGKITETAESITIESVNEICNYYEDGSIAVQKKVPCFISLKNYGDYMSLDGYEKTYAIIGGFATPRATVEQLESALKRYNFRKIPFKAENEQLTMF